MNSLPRRIRRGYVDGRFGQVHYSRTTEIVAQPALYCLHATAYSGQTFLPLMTSLGDRRQIIAIDTPGYGSSDRPSEEVDFPTYAKTIAEAMFAIEATDSASVDILGYHTGALLATEIAALFPKLVRRLILIGIPFFSGDEKAAWRKKLVHVTELTQSFDQFQHRWDYFIKHRTPGLSLSRAFDNFVDELRAYPHDWWAHKALFEYDAGLRLPLVQAHTLILNPAGALSSFSRDAAALLPNAMVIECPRIGGAPFDLATEQLADEIGRFLIDSGGTLAMARQTDGG